MKRFFLLLSAILFYGIAYSQQARQVIDFDFNWEIFVPKNIHTKKQALNVRNSTSFLSQFNQETVNTKQNEPADSILEYPKIKNQLWTKISLPHPVRFEMAENPGINQFTGICYYRKRFSVPDYYKGRHCTLRFDGAMQSASVWINGIFAGQHDGGYLPFVINLDGKLNFPDSNEIVVRLDNNDNADLPPGKPLAKLGFLYWSGIYRNVSLTVTDPVYITDPISADAVAGGGVFVRAENITSDYADVNIQTQIFNSTDSALQLKVKQIISDGTKTFYDSTIVSIAAHVAKNLTEQIHVHTPNLWTPDDPNLYSLTTQVWNNGELKDDIVQKTGIRKLSFTRSEGFTLNGQPLRIVGTNRHQDCPFVGNALSDQMQYRDLKRIKEAGFNFIRLSHYPQAPAVYQYCDSIGLMLCDPIPGWQFFNSNAIFKQRVFSDIRNMVRRDRNHPSVIMWEVSLNETYPADSFRIKSSQIAHEEYPGDNFFTAGDTYGAKSTAWDVPYNSWEDPFGRPQDVQPEKPGFVREYGDYEFGGSLSTTRANRTKGEKALLQNAWNLQWEHNLLMGPKYYPWTVGDASWAFFDGFEGFTKGTSDWGIMDIFRLPKFSYYFFKSQTNPVIYIANWWLPSDTPEKVIVYANCDEVALYLNGHFIKRQFADSGPDTEYGDYEKGGNSFDGGNCTNLNHPPFTFRNIKWKAGNLKAVGFIHGKEVSHVIVNTPLKAVRISLSVDTMGIPLKADGADAIFVHAGLVDKNGTTSCLDNNSFITFRISGPGIIVGPEKVKARGGISTVLIQATNHPGTIILFAYSDGLRQASVCIRSNK